MNPAISGGHLDFCAIFLVPQIVFCTAITAVLEVLGMPFYDNSGSPLFWFDKEYQFEWPSCGQILAKFIVLW